MEDLSGNLERTEITVEYVFMEKVTQMDVEKIFKLVRQLVSDSNSISMTEETLQRVIDKSRLLVARDADGRLAGMATLVTMAIPTAQVGRIEDVVVDKDYRQQGIGRELVQRLVGEAKRLGLERIDLTSNPTRIAARKLYVSLGFEQVDTNVYRSKL